MRTRNARSTLLPYRLANLILVPILVLAVLRAGSAAAEPDLIINEIHYHPATECEEEEFIELYHRGTFALDISGWHFLEGAPFEFPPGTTVAPGEYIVVARNPAQLTATYGPVDRLYGPWGAWPDGDGRQATLSNGGEDIVLADAGGLVVDRVRFNDEFPWAVSPDGGGPSLELLSPELSNDNAGNWRAAGVAGTSWSFYQAHGRVLDATLRLFLSAAGEYLVDDIELILPGEGVNRVVNGGFETGGGWFLAGNHSGSERVVGEAHTGDACLRVVATGPGGEGNAAEQVLTGLQLDGPVYTLSFWAKRVDPGIQLSAGFQGATTFLDTSEDIGAVGAAGSSSYEPGSDTYTVSGSGRDVWDDNDEFRFVHGPLFGDGYIEAEVQWSGTPSHAWAKAGVMIRDSTSPSSAYAMAILSRDNGVRLQFRAAAGGGCTDMVGPGVPGPVRLRLTRESNTFMAEADTGAGFTQYASTQITMSSDVRVGIMVTSHDDGQIARALFRGVTSNNSSLRITTPLSDDGPVVIATPGAENTQRTDQVPPYIRRVEHLPQEPTSSDPVRVQARISNPDGATLVTGAIVEYQVVPPGGYIRIFDPEYHQGWIPRAMNDDGVDGDTDAGDLTWTVTLPPLPNRSLVRYRIVAEDQRGQMTRVPYAGDECPNFAYFVYNGVPDYVAGQWSGLGPVPHVHPAEDLVKVPIYHLITDPDDLYDCWYNAISFSDKISRKEFRWRGTIVAYGRVYDHLYYRLRGGVWRYSYRKRYMKFRFLRGHHFEGFDNFGHPYLENRRTLNLHSVIGNPAAGNGVRGECGIYETLAHGMFRWIGVPSSYTTWVHFRIIDDANETGGDQYGGDFYGIYLDIEQVDDSYLDVHDRPRDGNLYKIDTGALNGRWEKEVNNCNPFDDSDIAQFVSTYNSSPSEAWWEANLDLEEYFGYRCGIETTRHYDIGAGKNYYYYNNPNTEHWEVFVWDVDLTFNTGYGSTGNEPFLSRVLNAYPNTFGLRYRNRMREVVDLMFREDRLFPIIDGWTDLIRELAAADRDRWHHLDGDGTHASLDQRMTELKAWIRGRIPTLNNFAAEVSVPGKPEITSPDPRAVLPADGLVFTSSVFDDDPGDFHAASRWIATEVGRFSELGSLDWDVLIPPESDWRFWRGRSEPLGAPLAWTTVGYTDTDWEEDTAGFGYDDGDDNTLLTDMRYTYTTVYIRRVFVVDDPSIYGALDLTVTYDDGLAVYLNGTEVLRPNGPLEQDYPVNQPIPNNTLARGNHEADGPEVFRLDSDYLSLLVPGENVLAIQGFNVTLDSSDFSLHPYLEAVIGDPDIVNPDVPLEEFLSENELLPDWDSGPTTQDLQSVQIPQDALDGTAGTIYRVRVRYEDQTGRWSRWSDPVEIQLGSPDNFPPTAVAEGSPLSGTAPLTVSFSGAKSHDPDGHTLKYSWDFGDGSEDEGVTVSHLYSAAGTYVAVLTVDDGHGGVKSASLLVRVVTPRTFIRGDFNGNGRLTIGDVVCILVHVYRSKFPGACEKAGDVNDDSTLDAQDALALLQFIFGVGDPPARPFPDPGPDPTGDQLPCP